MTSKKKPAPGISVCMPYFERPQALRAAVENLTETYPDLNLEIVVADDGTGDAQALVGDRATVVELPRKDYALNPCVPINRAIEAATHSVIVLTNPEVEHRQPVLGAMRERLKRNYYVTANCRDITTGAWLAKAGQQNGRLPLPEGAQFHFCAMFHCSTWSKVDGFDEQYRDGQACEDADWLWKLDGAGVKFIHCDDLTVYHHRSATRWPAGGLKRNQRVFCEKWNLSLLPA